jgi:pyruvate/2-oxoglutarate dehydrogenase complex dihydrolipoamide dehydrogenase (E3) component
MAESEVFDAIVIGAGQGGGPLATALARAGRRTALIERLHAGGTCINEGCTPTKTMVASARVAYLARRAADYGVTTGPVGVDLRRVRQRKRDIVASFRDGTEKRIESAPGLAYICGEAAFTGPKTLLVRPTDGDVNAQSRVMTAALMIIDTGSRPQRPLLAGLDQVQALDSTSIMELDEVPEHLLVLGGGYVGLEFAQMFRRFGSRVTIVQRGKQLLAREDADVAATVAQVLREDGIEILLDADADRVRAGPAGGVRLTVRSPDGERELAGSHLLLAAGRAPNSETLNLPATGITPDKRGFIPVNDRLETVVPGIYALGDVNGNPAFTHISYDDYRILRTNLILGGQASTKGRLVPYVVFIDPQLGRVGLSESEAREQGRQIKVAKMPMTSVARALEVDESRGFMKAVVDAATGEILGAAVLGIEGGEIMGMLEIAMLGKVPYSTLRDAIFAHPTLAETLNNLFATIE